MNNCKRHYYHVKGVETSASSSKRLCVSCYANAFNLAILSWLSTERIYPHPFLFIHLLKKKKKKKHHHVTNLPGTRNHFGRLQAMQDKNSM